MQEKFSQTTIILRLKIGLLRRSKDGIRTWAIVGEAGLDDMSGSGFSESILGHEGNRNCGSYGQRKGRLGDLT